jgi:G3E family GTPase
VVLNKADLVSDADLDAAERAIAAVNAEARVVRATRSVVDLGLVLNQGAVTVAGRRGKKPVLGGVAAVAPERVLRQGAGFWAKGVEKLAPQESAAAAAAPSDVHDASIRTTCLAVEGTLDRRAFETWLESVLWEGKAAPEEEEEEEDAARIEVLRAKGILRIEKKGGGGDRGGTTERMVLQAVREVYELTPAPPEGEAEPPLSKVVLIGRGLREEAMLEGLKRTKVG